MRNRLIYRTQDVLSSEVSLAYTYYCNKAYDGIAVTFAANVGNAVKPSMPPVCSDIPDSHSFANPARRLSYLLAGYSSTLWL